MGQLVENLSLKDRPVTVTVYRRTDPPTARAATATLERIEALADAGIIAGYEDVTVPPRQIGRRAGDTSIAADELGSVADELGVTLEPAMRRFSRRNRFLDETEEVAVLPVVTVLVRDAEDGSVLAAAPAWTDEGLVRVGDLLGRLTTEQD